MKPHAIAFTFLLLCSSAGLAGASAVGTSTGGVHSVSGTIGQPDAAPVVTGVNDNSQGGFREVIAAVVTSGASLLFIFHPVTNTVAVTLLSPLTGWDLQPNANSVASVNWREVTGGITDDGADRNFVVNPPTGSRFYRLYKP